MKKLSDWYAQQAKPNDKPADDKPSDDKKGCFSVVGAVGGTALAVAVGSAAVACGKRKKHD